MQVKIGDGVMSTKLAARKSKNLNGYSTVRAISAVFENGVFKPLSKVRLPQYQKLTIIVSSQEESIAAQMYGLVKSQNRMQLDTIIESEDWL
jgi:predicted DNA-binding antitoxin AbrB/MazE fold protein